MQRARPEDQSQAQPRCPGSITAVYLPYFPHFYIAAAEEIGDGLPFFRNPAPHEYLTTEHIHAAPRIYPRCAFEHCPGTNHTHFAGAGITLCCREYAGAFRANDCPGRNANHPSSAGIVFLLPYFPDI